MPCIISAFSSPRRQLLRVSALGAAAIAHPALLASAAQWQSAFGYPTGWGTRNDWNDKANRIGNYSGGFERMLRASTIQPSSEPSPLRAAPLAFSEPVSVAAKLAEDYVRDFPCTGLLIARNGFVLHERYQFGRTRDMRMTSWSMAKSVTSLLLGICIDRALIGSVDDVASKYVPRLNGTLHGGVSLRNLVNMSSGAEIEHERDNSTIYPRAFLTARSDIEAVVLDWNGVKETQGTRYNYNELCPLTIGLVIREVTGKSLSAFCEEALWKPMGAEAEATWLCDAKGREFNCIGFGACLRDWARVGQLIAQGGMMNGRQVVSRGWLDFCSSWSPQDQQVRFNSAMPGGGYKAFFWHPRANGSLMMMVGAYGQRMLIDTTTKMVFVHTAVDSEGAWNARMNQVWNSANAARFPF
ncbi:MAG: serine hydrolase [Pseudomonadota bacterium]